MNAAADAGEPRILVLTMPGFGIETLRLLEGDIAWPARSTVVGLIGRKPDWMRWWAARARLQWRNRRHPLSWLSEGPLAAMEAQRWLAARGRDFRWLESDDGVRIARASWNPDLTLTITSRVIFSAQTLNAGHGEWLNVHSGLLPQYAGAAPVPYMFRDGVAGCTIHRMAPGVDAGPIVDMAHLEGDLGPDGGTLLYRRLPQLAAARIVAVLRNWRNGTLRSHDQYAAALTHRTSTQLRRDRRLDWSSSASDLARWVRALTPFAPAWLVDRHDRRHEVRDAVAEPGPATSVAGTVLGTAGKRVRVACRDGSLWLETCRRASLRPGDRLEGPAPPLRP